MNKIFYLSILFLLFGCFPKRNVLEKMPDVILDIYKIDNKNPKNNDTIWYRVTPANSNYRLLVPNENTGGNINVKSTDEYLIINTELYNKYYSSSKLTFVLTLNGVEIKYFQLDVKNFLSTNSLVVGFSGYFYSYDLDNKKSARINIYDILDYDALTRNVLFDNYSYYRYGFSDLNSTSNSGVYTSYTSNYEKYDIRFSGKNLDVSLLQNSYATLKFKNASDYDIVDKNRKYTSAFIQQNNVIGTYYDIFSNYSYVVELNKNVIIKNTQYPYEGLEMSLDLNKILYTKNDQLYMYNLNSKTEALISKIDANTIASFNYMSDKIAYIFNSEVYVYDINTQKSTVVIKKGSIDYRTITEVYW
ncbi:MAG: hypothetical protein U0V72_12835 [Cytophagales bacterium]